MITRAKDFLKRLTVVKEPGYKSAFRQYWEMLWLFARYHLSPLEYYIYQLGKRDVDSSKLKEYLITSWAVRELRPRLNSKLWETVLSNKVLFHQHMLRHNLPVAGFFGLFHPSYGYSHTGEQLKTAADFQGLLQTIPGQTIIVKPVDGFKGAGISKYTVGTDGRLTLDGKLFSVPDMVEKISKGNGFLIEACLVNHAVIREYNPSSLNTCRIVTLVNKAGGCRVLFATARFGRVGSVADNWSAGGVAVGVDVETGVMGKGLILPQYGGEWVNQHPDSKVLFTGQMIPYWQETLDIVRQAALTLPWCHSIGWDVAITPEGPVIVEGNSQWNPSLGQAFIGGMLTPELREELTELGIKLPA